MKRYIIGLTFGVSSYDEHDIMFRFLRRTNSWTTRYGKLFHGRGRVR